MKICSKCFKKKPEYQFSPSGKKGSLCKRSYCKSCAKDHREQNKERKKLTDAVRYHARAQEFRLKRSVYRKQNRHKVNAYDAFYDAKKVVASPLWGNKFFIDEIYHLSQVRSKITGIEWHVDHIVPINSKKVCGLHVEFNMQVIPAILNRKKHNSIWPEMPL